MNHNDDLPPDPSAVFAEIEASRQSAIAAHDELRRSPGYEAAARRTSKLIEDYALALNGVSIASTRWSEFARTRLSIRILDLLLESIIATMGAVQNGLLNAAHRELRFLLEASVKAWWCDGSDRTGLVQGKIDALDDLGIIRFREIVDGLQPRMMAPMAAAKLMPALTNLYARLSTHVHPSTPAVGRALRGFEHGKRVGFEGIGELVAMNDLIAEVLDLSLASVFEAFDDNSTGDLFVEVFDGLPKWAFAKTPFVSAISAHFKYKAERQAR